MTTVREATPVEKALAWLHDVPADRILSANDQQLQYFTEDLEAALSPLNPEYRRRVREQSELPKLFGERPQDDVRTMRRRLGLIWLLGKKVLPGPFDRDFNSAMSVLLGK